MRRSAGASDETFRPGQGVSLFGCGDLYGGPQPACPQVGADRQDAGCSLDAQLGLEPAVEAELVGEAAPSCLRVVSELARWTGSTFCPSSPPSRRQTWRMSRSQLSTTSRARESP